MPEWIVTTKPYALTKDAYVRLNQQTNRRLIQRYSIGACVLTIVVFSLLIRPFGWAIGLVLSPGYYLLGHYSYKRRFTRFANANENQGTFRPYTASIDDAKISAYKEDGATSSYPWSSVVGYALMDDGLVLFMNQINFIYLAKEAFESEEDWRRVKQHIETTVPVRK